MEMILKNHRAFITLLGLWACPWFMANAHGLHKKHSKSFIKAFKKTKKCCSEKKDVDLNVPSFELPLIEAPYVLKNNLILPLDFFLFEKYSKKQSGLSPPLLV
jgi:hypothetical protein